jgi:hypothetical protein
VAEQHDKSAVSDVLMSRAKVEFEAANYPRFEALMLRCHKPELIIKQYQVRAGVGFYKRKRQMQAHSQKISLGDRRGSQQF